MRLEHGSWWTFLTRALVLGAVVFGAMRLAMARDGVAGGPSRSFLTVSGTLTGVGVPASPMATFRFSHATGGAATDAGMGDGVLCAPSVPITDRDIATGAFSVEVPLDQAGRECPSSLFDGSDAFVEVAIGSTVVVPRRPINPVPYARFADQAGVNNDCPAGYSRKTDADFVVCVKRRSDGSVYDEVVKVGTGGSAFWIDRYEASVWQNEDATGVEYFTSGEGFPDEFPRNGQWRRTAGGRFPVFARSLTNAERAPTLSVTPAVYITWFQAQAACRFSGKVLPTREQWLAAASGTVDPGDDPGNAGRCRTGNGAGGVSVGGTRAPGLGTRCRSSWGAEDMIGSAWDEWFVGVADTSLTYNNQPAPPDAGAVDPWLDRAAYNDDRTTNVQSSVGTRPGGNNQVLRGMPAAALRGGDFSNGTRSGIFTMDLNVGPSFWALNIGFRCVISR
jgi:Sulfatase-modifying factor enzyme 1